MSDVPITFTESSWCLFDVEQNAVLMTKDGNLAIFNTQGMAETWARSSSRNIVVREIRIHPVMHS